MYESYIIVIVYNIIYRSKSSGCTDARILIHIIINCIYIAYYTSCHKLYDKRTYLTNILQNLINPNIIILYNFMFLKLKLYIHFILLNSYSN